MHEAPPLSETIAKLSTLDPASVYALSCVAAERLRQIEVEGFTPDHDALTEGRLMMAAMAYGFASLPAAREDGAKPYYWPFDLKWWKPKSIRLNRVRAAALIVAEMARCARGPSDL
jgi:hypothetical protein